MPRIAALFLTQFSYSTMSKVYQLRPVFGRQASVGQERSAAQAGQIWEGLLVGLYQQACPLIITKKWGVFVCISDAIQTFLCCSKRSVLLANMPSYAPASTKKPFILPLKWKRNDAPSSTIKHIINAMSIVYCYTRIWCRFSWPVPPVRPVSQLASFSSLSCYLAGEEAQWRILWPSWPVQDHPVTSAASEGQDHKSPAWVTGRDSSPWLLSWAGVKGSNYGSVEATSLLKNGKFYLISDRIYGTAGTCI